jgi:hypothetical protein
MGAFAWSFIESGIGSKSVLYDGILECTCPFMSSSTA